MKKKFLTCLGGKIVKLYKDTFDNKKESSSKSLTETYKDILKEKK